MPVGSHLLGAELAAKPGSWTDRDCRLYALALGAGSDNPAEELQFTTENSAGIKMRVLPTFGLIEGCRVGVGDALRLIPDLDRSRMLHGEQRITQHHELPVNASVVTRGRVTALWDKGSAAVLETETMIADANTGQPYCTCVQSLYLRGYGGWGGERGPSARKQEPAAAVAPDLQLSISTRRDQALLYRLTGDSNPLHSDPAFAQKAGFSAPILHGLCVFGMASRVLLHKLAGSDPGRFRSFSARFSAPTTPGDELHVSVWQNGTHFNFCVDDQNGRRLLSDGVLELS